MNKKDKYDKKIEIIKKFLEADGNVETLIKIQDDNKISTGVDVLEEQHMESNNDKKLKSK